MQKTTTKPQPNPDETGHSSSEEVAFGGSKVLQCPKHLLAFADGDFSLFPITVHIQVSSHCNHDCVWCSDIGYRKMYAGFFDEAILRQFLLDLVEGGTKAINWTGSGEPTLYPEFEEITAFAGSLGLRQSLVTNGSRLHIGVVDPKLFSWVRVSLDAGKADTHKKFHRTSDFQKVLDGIQSFSSEKGRCTIGVSYLVNPDNASEVGDMIRLLDQWKVDYIRVKIGGLNPSESAGFEPDNSAVEVERNVPTEHLKVCYDELRFDGNAGVPCRASSLLTMVAPTGDVMFCCPNVQQGRAKEMGMGQLTAEPGSFNEIWQGEARKKLVKRFLDPDEVAQCPPCWMTRFNVEIDRLLNDRIDLAGMFFV